jgi:branched-chain amino acid transport system ATP-binding protein
VAEGPILTVEDVYVRFGGVHAVDGAGFEVQRGSVTALIGPNGAGKTTLFNVLTGFLRSERGQVVYDGARVTRRPPHAIAARGMVRTFQLTKTLAALTVVENMLIAAQRHPGERLTTVFARPPSRSRGRSGSSRPPCRAR